MAITKKQKEVYTYICDYIQKNGYSPTQKEIKDHFGFKSFGSVQRYLKYLNEHGLIETDWNARRGLKPKENETNESVDRSDNEYSREVPLLGKVAAGIPIEAIEQADQFISVPTHMLNSQGKFFALTVQGDSMIEDGILEGDHIICKFQSTANQGDTVVAVIDGEATVKRFYKKKQNIELHPANSSMEPIIVNRESGNFSIAGTLVGLVRLY